jgi:hypothetical protein
MNNLSAFRADGSARAIYIYPDAVNGNPMRRWDPLANDQDWALVFLMQAAQLDPSLFRYEIRPCFKGSPSLKFFHGAQAY